MNNWKRLDLKASAVFRVPKGHLQIQVVIQRGQNCPLDYTVVIYCLKIPVLPVNILNNNTPSTKNFICPARGQTIMQICPYVHHIVNLNSIENM